MDVKIYNKEKIRIYTDYVNERYINVIAELDSLQVEVLENITTIQVRRKDGFIKVFYFEPNTNLEDYDFGYYSDADILFSNH